MKLVPALLVGGLALGAATRPAYACGVPDFGMYLGAVADAFTQKHEPVHTPLLIIGGGTTTEGAMPSVTAGYGWGEKTTGGLFPGTSIRRVLLGLRSDGSSTAVSATYGWYANGFGAIGFDIGAEGQMSGTRGLGPTAKLTLGGSGVALRLTGGAAFGDATRFTGAAELVLDVMDLGDTL